MAKSGSKTTTLTLQLPREATEKLARRAAASGQDVAAFVSHLIEQFTEAPTPIDQLSGEIHQHFMDSGITEDELCAELDQAKHEMRAARHNRSAS